MDWDSLALRKRAAPWKPQVTEVASSGGALEEADCDFVSIKVPPDMARLGMVFEQRDDVLGVYVKQLKSVGKKPNPFADVVEPGALLREINGEDVSTWTVPAVLKRLGDLHAVSAMRVLRFYMDPRQEPMLARRHAGEAQEQERPDMDTTFDALVGWDGNF